MGLDMNVFRVQKPLLDENKVYDRDDISGIIIRKDETDDPKYRQLIPYCKKIHVVNHYYDMDKITEDYGITNPHIGGWEYGPNGRFTIIYGNSGRRVQINNDVIQSKYTIDRKELCYVCDREEIRYWRKAYEIQEWFHEHIPEPVENTGYYKLTQEMLLGFNKYFYEDQIPVEEDSDDYAFVYWEWY